MIIKSFEMLAQEKITKESLEIIFENIMNKKSSSVEEAIKNSSISSISDKEMSQQLDNIIRDNEKIIEKQGERAIGPLMGVAIRAITNGGLDANWMVSRGLPTVTLGCGQLNQHMVTEALNIDDFHDACRIALRLATEP